MPALYYVFFCISFFKIGCTTIRASDRRMQLFGPFAPKAAKTHSALAVNRFYLVICHLFPQKMTEMLAICRRGPARFHPSVASAVSYGKNAANRVWGFAQESQSNHGPSNHPTSGTPGECSSQECAAQETTSATQPKYHTTLRLKLQVKANRLLLEST